MEWPLAIFSNNLSQTNYHVPLTHINGKTHVRPWERGRFLCVCVTEKDTKMVRKVH